MLFSIPLVMLFYMWGGQTEKWVRPTGVALSLYGIYLAFQWAHPILGLPCLLYGMELAFGYGEKSLFHKLSGGVDWLDRLLYSIWCCIPIIVTCVILKHYVQLLGCVPVVLAFQIHTGSWFKMGKYDFLGEDFYRSLTIAESMSWAIIGG